MQRLGQINVYRIRHRLHWTVHDLSGCKCVAIAAVSCLVAGRVGWCCGGIGGGRGGSGGGSSSGLLLGCFDCFSNGLADGGVDLSDGALGRHLNRVAKPEGNCYNIRITPTI